MFRHCPDSISPQNVSYPQCLLELEQDGLERLAVPITMSLEDLDGITEDKVTRRTYHRIFSVE